MKNIPTIIYPTFIVLLWLVAEVAPVLGPVQKVSVSGKMFCVQRFTESNNPFAPVYPKAPFANNVLVQLMEPNLCSLYRN